MTSNYLISGIAKTLFTVVALAAAAVAAAGDPDPSFGTGGTATDFLATSSTVNKVILQPDGKLIVVGKRLLSIAPGQPLKDYLMVRRYTAAGALETTFNTAFRQGIGFDAEVLPDGSVVILGHAPNTFTSPLGGVVISTTSPVIWKFNQNGVIDTSFGSNGTRFFNAQSGGNFNIEVLNSQIVVLYASRNPLLLGDYSYKVARVSETGSVDYTITLPYTYASYNTVTMKVDAPASDILAVSGSQLRRYTIDGAVDASFGTNGAASVPYCHSFPGLPITSKDLEIQPDGGILVLSTYIYMQASAVNVTRQTAIGVPDPTVCQGMTLGTGVGSDLLLQPDGRFFFLGGGGSGIRYFADGSAATNVGNLTQNPQVIQPDQKLVTARTTASSLILTRQLLD
jgi:uncharacterized delta-60 repeat protein